MGSRQGLLGCICWCRGAPRDLSNDYWDVCQLPGFPKGSRQVSIFGFLVQYLSSFSKVCLCFTTVSCVVQMVFEEVYPP